MQCLIANTSRDGDPDRQAIVKGNRSGVELDYNIVRPHSSLGYKPPAPEAILWPATSSEPATPATPAVAPRPVMH